MNRTWTVVSAAGVSMLLLGAALFISGLTPFTLSTNADGQLSVVAQVADACCDGGSNGGSDGGTWECYSNCYGTEKPVKKKYCEITAYPGEIKKGESTKLKWKVVKDPREVIHGNPEAVISGVGSVSGESGQKTVKPYQTTTYKLTITYWMPGFAGVWYADQVECETKVVVKNKYESKPPVCWMWQWPETSIKKGESVTIGWGSENGSSATLSGYGDVGLEDEVELYPTKTTTYTLTVYGGSGKSTQCTATVKVENKKPYSSKKGNESVYSYFQPYTQPYAAPTQASYESIFGGYLGY